MLSTKTSIASNRFGLGQSLKAKKLTSKNIENALINQLKPLHFDKKIAHSSELISLLQEYRTLKKQQKKQTSDNQLSTASIKTKKKSIQTLSRNLTVNTLTHAINTEYSFQARLLDFFSNHFSVSQNNMAMRALAPTLEREAIAPNISGHFHELLLAVEQHPTMLLYLNNAQSIGPRSTIGERKNKGLNENLAREILELHTLGTQGGYKQHDVRELAMAITGWSIAYKKSPGFIFRHKAHEPGTRAVLNKAYPQQGIDQGQSILKDLATHPSTAHHLSYKLAQHFISDTPDIALVNAMKQRWLETQGHLTEVLTVLIEHPSSWKHEQEKYKTPRELLISSLRIFQPNNIPAKALITSLTLLGQAPFSAGSPAGYSDLASDWNGPEALITRIEWADSTSHKLRELQANISVVEIADYVLGLQLTENTRTMIKRAESREQALTLLLMSPEFQRR